MKILKIFIFWFFNLFDRLYTFTLGPDLYTARRSGYGSCSSHFILAPKVATIYYRPPYLEALFFPRGNFFRRCGHESAPRVHFCAATPGSDKFHDCSHILSLFHPKECDFLAEKHAFHLGGQNSDPVKRQKHHRGVTKLRKLKILR